jgi:hypothetical protein
MAAILLYPYTVQAVRPTCHWWLRPRVFAWFRVLMVLSLVKPPASAGPLSRIGDYLLAARGPGLFLRIKRRTTFPHESAVTRGPPYPLFHRRPSCSWSRIIADTDGSLQYKDLNSRTAFTSPTLQSMWDQDEHSLCRFKVRHISSADNSIGCEWRGINSKLNSKKDQH